MRKIYDSTFSSEQDKKDFKTAIRSLLSIPVNSRSGFSSIRRVEKALESETEFSLERDDYQFLIGQLEYGFQMRLLQNPKAWENVCTILDGMKD